MSKIAIVGMDAFFGECNGLDAFESSIYDGKQHFIPLPEKRWLGIDTQSDLLKQYGLPSGKPPLGAYIKDFDVDTFAYKIPPNELEKLNPQQLLLLKVCDRALKDAKISPNGNVAVIIAAETEFSVHQLQQRWSLSWQVKDGLNGAEIALPAEKITQLETIVKDSVHHQVEIGEYLSYIANIMASRISSLWNFNGPALTMTAGETSVFKALEVAQMLLATQEVDAVVVGAVDLAGGVENVLLRNQWATVNTGVATLGYDQGCNGWTVGEGAGAVVLKRHDVAQAGGDNIYAVIDAVALGSADALVVDAVTINQVCNRAFVEAGIQASDVDYLEVSGSGIPKEDEAEIAGLLQAYPPVGDGLHCAMGSVKANIGHTYVAAGMASLIKTALCLYHRYIPATPNWSGVKTPVVWEGSPFYVAMESRPWFVDKEGTRRIAAVNGMGCDGSYAHLILSESSIHQERQSRYLQQVPFYLLPVVVESQAHLQEVLNHLQKSVEASSCLSTTASQIFANFQQYSQSPQRGDENTSSPHSPLPTPHSPLPTPHSPLPTPHSPLPTPHSQTYTLSITGRHKKELLKEIESARKGINNAWEQGKDWQTPSGSYFSPKPLGKYGSVAYVYPAAVNSYVGIGQNLFRLFPKVYDDTIFNSLASRATYIHQRLYPRSLPKLTTRQLENLEKELLDDSLAMFETEIAYSRLITTIIRDDFQVKPQCVFGYSLGETSMMSAQGVWSNFHGGSNTLNSSPLFGDRLSGRKNAVREYWGLTGALDLPDNHVWVTYVLMATPSQVRECIKHEQRVYLTQINTPEEVLIAGEPAACQRVIQILGCNAFAAPFDHVIHCETMRSEYKELVKLNTLPAQDMTGVVFYSAAEYQPIVVESDAIAHNIATGLCQQLDFPKLVNRVYADGVKIFIEAGAGSACSRWINKILASNEHITVSLNRRGMDDHTAIVKALAKLVSHQVNVDLSLLYVPLATPANPATLRTVTLGGNSIVASILSEQNRQLFQDVVPNSRRDMPSTLPNHIAEAECNSHHILPSPTFSQFSMKSIINHAFEIPEKLQSSELETTKQPIASSILSLPTPTPEIERPINMLALNQSQYQKLNANNSKITKAHTTFLQARHNFSQQMSEIIELQLACAQNLLNEES
jgi:PfaB family protein